METPCTTVDYLTRCGVLLVGALFSYFATTQVLGLVLVQAQVLVIYHILSLITERQSPFFTLLLEFIFDSLPLKDTNFTSTVQYPNTNITTRTCI